MRNQELLDYLFYIRIAWLEDKTTALLSRSLIGLQFHFVPFNLACRLRNRDMGDKAAVTDKYDARNLADLDSLIATIVDLACLIINPFARGEVAYTLGATFKKGRYEDLRAKHIFVLDVPCARIVGELDEQSANHWETAVGAILGLRIDIRHETILELSSLAESVGEILADEPRLGWGRTMGTAVRRKEAEREPTTVDILG